MLWHLERELMMATNADGEILGCIETTCMQDGSVISDTSHEFFVFKPSVVSESMSLQHVLVQSADCRSQSDLQDLLWIDHHRVSL